MLRREKDYPGLIVTVNTVDCSCTSCSSSGSCAVCDRYITSIGNSFCCFWSYDDLPTAYACTPECADILYLTGKYDSVELYNYDAH